MTHPFLGRIAATVAAMIVTFFLDLLGAPLTEDQKAGVIAWLTTGLNALGGFVLLMFYGIFHKAFNKRLNPGDTAL